ncbi:hypothetical protein [Tenacibaculum piscium]|uniref:hypothetical protein n=1 Tax=Tenacibaculum piscium TaxID=1458515 RepID=UPI001F21DD5C|nr:hypothetical protein [Tenacibaculum piscium]
MNDILLDQDGDLMLVNGDFVIGDASEQSVAQILISKSGQWKEYPQIGADIQKSQHGKIDRFLERNISVQLASDGFNVDTLEINEKGINLKGSYD